MAPNWSQNFNASYPNLPQFHDFFRFFCNFSTAHITPGDCCHSGDGLEPAGEIVDDRYSDCRSDFGYLYARIAEDDPLGFFDTEGIEPLADTDLEVQKSSEHSPLVMFEINLTV